MAKVGEGAFNIQIGGIDLISNNVEKIAKWLMKETAQIGRASCRERV